MHYPGLKTCQHRLIKQHGRVVRDESAQAHRFQSLNAPVTPSRMHLYARTSSVRHPKYLLLTPWMNLDWTD